MTTLVTGFEPFGGAALNPSQEVVRALAASAGAALVTAVLPVSYRRSATELESLLELHRPRHVILLGLDRSAPHVKLETLALNRDDASAPDSDGERRTGRRILEDAPETYGSTLPLDALAAVAARVGEPSVFSSNAGGYVCNHTFFVAQHLTATRYPGCRSGFVHVPNALPGSPALERLTALVRAWISELESTAEPVSPAEMPKEKLETELYVPVA